jgi:hypothetical protein
VASLKRDARAIGAVVARFVHTEEVTGSNPVSPTWKALVRSMFVRRARGAERMYSSKVQQWVSIRLVNPGSLCEPI